DYEMKFLARSSSLLALSIGVFALPAPALDEPAPPGEVRYLVKFKSVQRAGTDVAAVGGKVARELGRQRIAAVYLSEQALRLLRNNPNVESVEVDRKRYPDAQSQPFGIGMVQAD